MKIRIRFFLIIIGGVFLLGYIFGGLWPFRIIMYDLSEEPVNKGQNLSNLIAIFSSIFTLLAVVVALFKDEIVGNFKSVELDVAPICDTIEVSYDESMAEEDPTISKYYNNVIFNNQGNINALGCELQVENIEFKGPSDLHQRKITFSKKKVMLGGQEQSYIPKNGGKRETSLIEIMTSEDPEGNKKIQLSIAENQVQPKAGLWIVEYCLNMSNANIRHYKFQIEWDGKWHDNKSMMQITTRRI